jgi:hypothetical protein
MAWDCTDWAELWAGPSTRGTDIVTPYRQGQTARPREVDSKEANLPIVIYGKNPPDGSFNGDLRGGLYRNIDAFKRLIASPSASHQQGLRLLEMYGGNGEVRRAWVHVSTDLQLTPFGPAAVRGVLTITNPSGVMVSSDPKTLTGVANTEVHLDSAEDGSTTSNNSVITANGSGGSLKLTNLTYDITGGEYLKYNAAWSGTLVLNASTMTATLNGTRVDGNVITSGTPLWLPIYGGISNAIKVEATGGSATVTISYSPAWL